MADVLLYVQLDSMRISLQEIVNLALQAVFNVYPWTHVEDVLMDLTWLQVNVLLIVQPAHIQYQDNVDLVFSIAKYVVVIRIVLNVRQDICWTGYQTNVCRLAL